MPNVTRNRTQLVLQYVPQRISHDHRLGGRDSQRESTLRGGEAMLELGAVNGEAASGSAAAPGLLQPFPPSAHLGSRLPCGGQDESVVVGRIWRQHLLEQSHRLRQRLRVGTVQKSGELLGRLREHPEALASKNLIALRHGCLWRTLSGGCLTTEHQRLEERPQLLAQCLALVREPLVRSGRVLQLLLEFAQLTLCEFGAALAVRTGSTLPCRLLRSRERVRKMVGHLRSQEIPPEQRGAEVASELVFLAVPSCPLQA
mmetsp:Transcript_5782/g.22028  ORF Transcript_5782/g.22028 Transcript_5782/m.22028 type:complete len:258 (-) Transcript_5782:663-1436(-)